MFRNKLVAALALGLLVFMACGPAAAPQATPTATRPPPTTAPTATPTPQKAVATTPTAAPTLAPPVATPPGKPQSGGVLKVRWRAQVQTFELHKRGSLGETGSMVFNSIFTPMAQRVPAGPCKFTIEKEGAESWKWVNDTTFELKIRPDLKFVDKPPVNGRQATAQDVIWSLQRYKDFHNRGIASMRPILSITEVDPLTIRFVTKTPYPGIVDTVLANHYGGVLLPREVEKDGLIDENGWLGTGPFYAKGLVPGVKLNLERNPNYYKKGFPYVDGVEWLVLTDVSTGLAAMRAGKIDLWARDLSYLAAAPFIGSDIKVLSCLELAPAIYYMRNDLEPFSDIRVRRALSMSLDREGLLKSLYQGKGTLIGYAAPSHPWMLRYEDYPPEVRHYIEYHPDESKKLLAEAGYSKGLDVSIYYDVTAVSIFRETVEALVDMFSRVGVKLTLKPLTATLWATQISARSDFESMVLTRTNDIDPYLFLGYMHTQAGLGTNRGRVRDPALDKLIDDFMSTLDLNKAKDLARQIQVRIVDQAYMIRPPANDDFRLAGPRVRDFPEKDSMTAMMSLSWVEKLWLAR